MKRSPRRPVAVVILATAIFAAGIFGAGIFVAGPGAFAQSDTNKTIEFQAQDAAKQLEQRADQRVQRNNNIYQSEIDKTKTDARSAADYCSVWDGWGEKQFILDQAKAKEQYMKDMEQKTADSDIQNMKQRAESISESAKNLQTLVDEKPSDPGVHVDPNGTNLYVRNYK